MHIEKASLLADGKEIRGELVAPSIFSFSLNLRLSELLTMGKDHPGLTGFSPLDFSFDGALDTLGDGDRK